MSLFDRNAALAALYAEHGAALAVEEKLAPADVRAALENGTMVLLGNPSHAGGRPLLVGQPSRVQE